MLNVVNSNMSVTSKRRVFIQPTDTMVSVHTQYDLFRKKFGNFLKIEVGIQLNNEKSYMEIFMEVLNYFFTNRIADMTSEPIVDILDTVVSEDLNTDKLFDFQNIMVFDQGINEIFDFIVRSNGIYDMNDYIVTDSNDMYILLRPRKEEVPRVMIKLPLPVCLDVFFTVNHVSTKRAETLFFISSIIDIAIKLLKRSGEYPDVDNDINNIMLTNKIYPNLEANSITSGIETNYTPLIFNDETKTILTDAIKKFTDDLSGKIKVFNFNVRDIVVEDVINRTVIGFIRGED